jgi:flagella basal body P-ring formation protein FlgA
MISICNQYSTLWRVLTCMIITLPMDLWPGSAISAGAAEQIVLRFQIDPQISNSIVRLGDIVEIVAGNAPSLEKLRDTPLGPAPRLGAVQTWHRSDVLQHLELRGVQPGGVRWTGPESMKLHRAAPSEDSKVGLMAPAFTDQRVLDVATNNVSIAIKDYLNLQSRSRTDWRVSVDIPTESARLLQSRSMIASIGGGESPWTGEQNFVIQVKKNGKLIELPLRGEVSLPPMVVVAKGPLRRDQILTEDLLAYAPLPRNADERNYFTEISQLVGKQLRRSVSTSQAIDSDLLGEPIVISRNDMVEVESISGNVVVRTTGKSLGNGAVGELVDVEMPNRRKILATVMGPSKVRISAVSLSSNDR